jgi:alkaline phosphatase
LNSNREIITMQPYTHLRTPLRAILAIVATGIAVDAVAASISRLTPPSELFASGNAAPVIARFLPNQRFDLQATIEPDPGQSITQVRFYVNDRLVQQPRSIIGNSLPHYSTVAETGNAETCVDAATGLTTGASGCILRAGLPANSVVASHRAFSHATPGVHRLEVVARQSNGTQVRAEGNFEIIGITRGGQVAKNIIIMFGDGMGAGHRTAARIMTKGYAQGMAKGRLAMDTFSHTGMVMTASLNSIVTDSAPGMANYVNGNKANNNEEGVFPDDTRDAFDNPRVEYLSEYLHRLQGKSLGIVSTADVFDATPAANAIHTSARGNGTGIVDQFLDDRHLTGLSVLMGGGRKWFLPNQSDSVSPQPSNGSQRRTANDYMLPDDIVNAWGASRGELDPARDLIAEFESAGFHYAPDKSAMDAAFAAGRVPDSLLGLFAYSNMNVAFDKIAARRGDSTVVDAFGFPDQPMLDEMTDKALRVLSKNRNGFVLMVEAASIDKQAHLMDTERWILDVAELDRAVAVAKAFADENPDTLVIVTADHECSGAAIIGAATATAAELQANPGAGTDVVGPYEAAAFPAYEIADDGYPQTTHVDYKMLIGYGGNADRYETWMASEFPTADSQQPFPVVESPANPGVRNEGIGYLVSGQVPGTQAVHTATDIPLSAHGRGASLFNGVFDNTDVFFKFGQAAIGGVDD